MSVELLSEEEARKIVEATRRSIRAAAERAAGEDARRLLDAIRKHCKVIYFGADWREYPIEHNPFAQKDMWDAIVAKLTGSMFVNDRMLAADRETEE